MLRGVWVGAPEAGEAAGGDDVSLAGFAGLTAEAGVDLLGARHGQAGGLGSGVLDPSITQLHAADYRNPGVWDRTVLVLDRRLLIVSRARFRTSAHEDR